MKGLTMADEISCALYEEYVHALIEYVKAIDRKEPAPALTWSDGMPIGVVDNSKQNELLAKYIRARKAWKEYCYSISKMDIWRL